MAFQAGAIVSQLTLDRSKFSAAMKQVTGEVKGFSGVIKQNSAQLKKMGRQMAVGGAAIVGTIGLMVKAFATFDEAMVKSLAIMGDVSPAMRKAMAETAKQMSTESTFAAKELAEAYFFLASAGMTAEQSIAALPAVARFAQAGTFDLSLATDLLTDAQTAMGLSSEDTEVNLKNLVKVSDILVKANTLANATVQQFSEALTNRAAPALRAVRKSMEEGVAVLAAYADQGIKGRKAGMQLGMMLNALDIAARDNKKEWEKHGLALFDAQGEMRHMADLIADVEVLLGDMSTEQRGVTLAELGFTAETKNSILALMGMSESIRQYSKDLKVAGGITKEVSDKQLKAFNAQITMLKNTVIKGAIAIGARLAPMIEELTKKIKNVVARVTAWIEEHPKLTEWIGKLALAVGTLLIVLGPLVMMLPGLAVGFGLVKVAVLTLAGPVGIAAAALVGIALAIKDIIKTHKEAIKAMGDMAMGAAIMANAAENFQKLWIAVRKEGGPALDEFNELMTRFGGDWDKILKQIIADPKLAILKVKLIEVAREIGGISAEGKNLSITLPGSFVKIDKAVVATKKVFTSWATTVGKIFHDTSVRAADMRREMRDIKLTLPPLAIKMPKFTLETEIGTEGFETFEEWFKAWVNGLMKKWKTAWQAAVAGSKDVVSALEGVFNQFAENQATRLDSEEKQHTDVIESWFEKERERIETTITNEEKKIAALEALDEEKARKENKLQHRMDKERRKLERARAKGQKASALFSAGINVAEAITKAFTSGPLIGQILAGIVAALGAVQMAAIAAAPLPALAKGGRIGAAGIVGEEGPELFFPRTPGTIVPLRSEATPLGSQPSISIRIMGSLISTTGVARADLERAGNTLFDIIEMQARRRGYTLNGT